MIRKAHAARPRSNTKSFERIYLLNGLIRCASCGRNLRAQGYRSYRYYRESSRLRSLECPSADIYVQADLIEQQIGRIVQAFEFPHDWKKELRDALNSGLEQDHLKDERKEIMEKLKRLGDLYLDGRMERQSYLSTRKELNQRLGHMSLPEPTQLIETGQTLESFLQIWPLASESQKRDICHLMFEWVEADMEEARITPIMPRYEFTRFFEKNDLLAMTSVEVMQ
jgi:site-specific DNA recombinase